MIVVTLQKGGSGLCQYMFQLKGLETPLEICLVHWNVDPKVAYIKWIEELEQSLSTGEAGI